MVGRNRDLILGELLPFQSGRSLERSMARGESVNDHSIRARVGWRVALLIALCFAFIYWDLLAVKF